jgi:hypothetical protein
VPDIEHGVERERCLACADTGYKIVNHGHTVNADGTLGGRGMQSVACHCAAGIAGVRGPVEYADEATPHNGDSVKP